MNKIKSKFVQWMRNSLVSKWPVAPMFFEYRNILNFYIVYCFFSKFFMKQYIENLTFLKISMINRIVVENLVFLYPVLFILFIYMINKWNREEKHKRIFHVSGYFGENMMPRIKNVNYHMYALGLPMTVILLVVLLEGMFINRNKLIDVAEWIHGMVWERGIDSITLVITIYGIIIAIFPCLVAYIEKKSMFFNAYDLSSVKNILRFTIISGGLVIVVFGMQKVEKLHELSLILEMSWIILIILNIGMVIISVLQLVIVEKRMISNLEKVYEIKKIHVIPSQKWYRGGAIYQIKKLFDKHKKAITRIDFRKINSLDFDCVYSERYENQNVAKEAYRNLIFMAIIFGFIIYSVLYTHISFLSWYCLFIAMGGIVPVFIPMFNKRVWNDNYKVINELGHIPTWGYYMELVNKKNVLFFSSYGFKKSKYKEYIMSLKRIGCFYNLAVNMKYEDTEYFDFIGIDCLCDLYEDDCWISEEINGFLLAPIIVCACLGKEEKKDIHTRIVEMMDKIKVRKSEKEFVKNVCLLVLRDIEGNDENYRKSKYEEIIGEILKV